MPSPDLAVFVQVEGRIEPLALRRHVAANIAACRRRAGLSQAEVGRMLGLEKETVCRIEKAKISVTVDRLQEFAAIFQCSLHEFLFVERRPC